MPALKLAYPYLIVATICSVLMLYYALVGGTSLSGTLFAYQRDFFETGQWWRIVTAHFMHSNVIHFAVNIIGLFLLWMLHAEYTRPFYFAVNILILSLGVSLCIYIWSPSIFWYVGLSGVLHGLFAWGVIIDIYFRRKTGYLLLIGLVIKIIDEQYFSTSQLMSQLIEVKVAVDAHFYGAVLGLILGLVSVYLFPSSIQTSPDKQAV